GERYSDYAAVFIHQRPAGSARRGLRVVDNLVRQHIAYVPLRYQRTNQLSLGQLGHDEFRVAAAYLQNLIDSLVTRSRQNRTNSRRVAQRNQRLSADGGFLAAVQPQRRALQSAQVAV